MGKSRLSHGDLIWSYGAQVFQYGSYLIVIPLLLRHLTAAEVGIWYAFNLTAMLVMLLDFGFQSTLTRNLSYVASGAQSLEREGARNLRSRQEINHVLLASVVSVARANYRRISVWTLAALLTIGSCYIAYIGKDYPNKVTLAFAWLIFAGGTTYSFYWTYLGACLSGLGAIKEAQQTAVISRLAGVAGTVGGLVAGWGILGAVTGFVLGNLAAPFMAKRFLTRRPDYSLASRVPVPEDLSKLSAIMWHNGKKLGSVSIATFLVIRSSVLIASLFLPLDQFAAYALTLQVLQLLITIARANFNAAMPILSSLAAQGKIDRFRQQFLTTLFVGWTIYLLGCLALFFAGAAALRIVGSQAQLLPPVALSLLMILYFMEITHGNSAMALTCFNEVPFVAATWLTGLAILAGALISTVVMRNVVIGFVISQLAAQCAYNAWKWPIELRRKLKS